MSVLSPETPSLHSASTRPASYYWTWSFPSKQDVPSVSHFLTPCPFLAPQPRSWVNSFGCVGLWAVLMTPGRPSSVPHWGRGSPLGTGHRKMRHVAIYWQCGFRQKLFNLSELWFPHLENGSVKDSSKGLFWELETVSSWPQHAFHYGGSCQVSIHCA